MYVSNDEIVASLEAFAGKIPDSLIKSRVEKWIAEIRPTERITSEQLEQFLAFSTHLPQELQNYPQSFAMWVKNGAHTEEKEANEETEETADLGSLVDDSIADVPDVDAPDDLEETEHKLGAKKGVGGKKISPAAKKGAKAKKK